MFRRQTPLENYAPLANSTFLVGSEGHRWYVEPPKGMYAQHLNKPADGSVRIFSRLAGEVYELQFAGGTVRVIDLQRGMFFHPSQMVKWDDAKDDGVTALGVTLKARPNISG